MIVGVSGGLDSVTLLHTLNQLKTKLKVSLHVVHFNHNLRGEESLRDAKFVESLTQKLDLPYTLGSNFVREFTRSYKMSIEEAGRKFRYQFFQEVAQRINANKIATAHTADDQAETLLLRLLQGTGLAGLTGIRPILNSTDKPIFSEKTGFWNGQIIRPFIEITRKEIENFAQQEKLEYVKDSSNLNKRYLRNKIRLDLLPLLKQEFNPQIIKRLATTTSLLQDDFCFLEQLTEAGYNQVCRQETNQEISIDLNLFVSFHPALQRRILRRSFESLVGTIQGFESHHVQAAINLLTQGDTGKSIDLPKGISIRKSYNQGIMSKRSSPIKHQTQNLKLQRESPGPGKTKNLQIEILDAGLNPGSVLRDLELEEKILEVPGTQNRNGLTFTTQVFNVDIRERRNFKNFDNLSLTPEFQVGSLTASFDVDKLRFPLRIRKRKPGDRFQPMGMKGQKKLQDLLVDLKIPREKRDLLPILQDEEGIIWVVGFRIAERVKVNFETQKILTCTVTLQQVI